LKKRKRTGGGGGWSWAQSGERVKRGKGKDNVEKLVQGGKIKRTMTDRDSGAHTKRKDGTTKPRWVHKLGENFTIKDNQPKQRCRRSKKGKKKRGIAKEGDR